MRKLSTIRPFVALIFLFVFAFAITPKRYLHNLVADHTDSTYSKLITGKTEIAKAGFNCQIDNLVATSPFTSIIEEPETYCILTFISHQEKISSSNLCPAHTYFKLRGPPVVLPI